MKMFWEKYYKPALFKMNVRQLPSSPANIPRFQTNISIFPAYSISAKDKNSPRKKILFLSGQKFQFNWKVYNKKNATTNWHKKNIIATGEEVYILAVPYLLIDFIEYSINLKISCNVSKLTTNTLIIKK